MHCVDQEMYKLGQGSLHRCMLPGICRHHNAFSELLHAVVFGLCSERLAHWMVLFVSGLCMDSVNVADGVVCVRAMPHLMTCS